MVFHSELLKLKNTVVLWLIVFAALTVPLLVSFDFIDHSVPEVNGINPWDNFWDEAIKGFVVFIGPFIIVLLTAMFMNVEHKYNTWRYMLTLPQNKSSIYISKLLINLILLSLLYTLFLLFFLLAGSLLGWLYPKMGFLNNAPNFISIGHLAFRSLISFLGILSIHFWISIRVKNVFINIGLGLLFIFIAIMLFKKMDKVIYYPYSDGLLTVFHQYPKQGFLAKNEIYSLLLFLLVSFLSYLDFVKKFRG